jgi:serine/threonine protein kinase/Flp pilus assembly protein TadD
MIDRTVLHYKILSKLGEGGMGVVYKARDTKLDRDVALKFLPSQSFQSASDRSRFLAEARAAAALHHPNVCSIFDIQEIHDEQFMVMEYVEGRTLRSLVDAGPLPVAEGLALFLHLVDGLRAAHRRGIIHRDIKPENVLITPDGVAKIADFGLALARGSRRTVAEGTREGTISYMAPEILNGEEPHFTSDVWSLGIVLYEILSGRKPFAGEYEQAVIYSILNEPYPELSSVKGEIPASLRSVIARCLAKNPADRFSDAEGIYQEVRRLSTSGISGGAVKKIAVLPLADMSPEQDSGYFVEGLTDEIIASLSKLSAARVLSRATVSQFDRTGKMLDQIAAELGVQYVLDGSVRKNGPNLRITIQLIDAEQDTVLWAENFSGTIDEIFEIQEKVAARVVRGLRVRLTPDQRKTLKQRATKNTEAYQLYLQGRFFWSRRTAESFMTAISYFERAIALDPGYAKAWAGIADSYNLLSQYHVLSRKETYQKAHAAVEKALSYDDKLAEAHTSYGSLLMLNGWHVEEAGREFRRAIELNASYATAHHWYAEWLMYNGLPVEALREFSIATELDPLSPAIIKDLGLAQYYARNYDAAIRHAREALLLHKEFGAAHRLLSMACLQKGRIEEAIEENHLWQSLTGNDMEAAAGLAYCYAVGGRVEEAMAALDDIGPEPVSEPNMMRNIALVHIALGNKETALDWIEKACDAGSEAIASMKVDPKMDPLRNEPRFTAVLRKIGFGE